MTHESYLLELKNNLKSQAISLLVGSGFSKNVSELFPNWKNFTERYGQCII